MCSSLESDNCLYMLQSGSKYYIWNPIEGGVWEFMEMRRESRVRRTGAKVEPGLSPAEENRWAGVKIPVVLHRDLYQLREYGVTENAVNEAQRKYKTYLHWLKTRALARWKGQ